MRVKNDLTYQEYKDGVYDAFNLLGKKGWEKAEDITNYMTDEDDYFLVSGSTSLALWIISIGEYEIRHNLLEERVLEQLSYHIPRYKMGKYKDITEEEKKELEKDIEFIENNIELWKLTDEELEAE